MHWREGRRIVSYGPAVTGQIAAENQDAGAEIDLAHDVVASQAEIEGSIKRVTRAYADGLIAHCRRSGTNYTVLRRGGH